MSDSPKPSDERRIWLNQDRFINSSNDAHERNHDPLYYHPHIDPNLKKPRQATPVSRDRNSVGFFKKPVPPMPIEHQYHLRPRNK